MNLQLPTRFVLLDKAIATLGSVGVELYEDFNVFEVAKPYARSLLRDRLTPRSLAREGRRELSKLAFVASEFPHQLHDVMEELRDGQIEVGFVHKGLDAFMVRLDAALNRLVIALVVVGGLIGSSLIGIFANQGPQVLGVNVLSFIGFLLSGFLGLWLLWGSFAPVGSSYDTSTSARSPTDAASSVSRTFARRSSAVNGFWMYAVPGCRSSCCSIRSPV